MDVQVAATLSDYMTLASELQACCRLMTKVKGAQKLERRIGTEIKFFQSLSSKDEATQAAQLQSSNLSHFAALVHAATYLPGVTRLVRPFPTSGRRHSLEVDVVAHHGRSWVKVVARKGQALHLVWAGQGQFGERDMVQQLKEYQQCARHHPVSFHTPRVLVAFYNTVTAPMATTLQGMGVQVLGEVVPVHSDISRMLAASQPQDQLEDSEDEYQSEESEDLTDDEDDGKEDLVCGGDLGNNPVTLDCPSDFKLVPDSRVMEDDLVCDGENDLVCDGENDLVCDGENDLKCDGENDLVCDGGNVLVCDGGNDLVCDGENDPVCDGENDLVCDGENDLVCDGENDPVCDGENDLVCDGEKDLVCDGENDLVCDGENDPVCDGEKDLVCDGEKDLVCDGEKDLVCDGEKDPVCDGENDLVCDGENDPVCDGEKDLVCDGEKDLVCDGEKDLVRDGKENDLVCDGETVHDKNHISVVESGLRISLRAAKLNSPFVASCSDDSVPYHSRLSNKVVPCSSETASKPQTIRSYELSSETDTSRKDQLESSDLQTDSAQEVESEPSHRHTQGMMETPPGERKPASSSSTASAWQLSLRSVKTVRRILLHCPDLSPLGEEEEGSGGEGKVGRGREVVNLDITTLITLVSAVCHGGCRFRFQDKVLDQQAAEERETPTLPDLATFLQDKDWIVCRSAWEDFNKIVQLLGGPSEQERAEELLNRLRIVDDKPSERASKLRLRGKVKDRSKVVFGTGDAMQAVTVTANSGFIRAAESQNVSFAVHMHPARALTEQKERTASPL